VAMSAALRVRRPELAFEAFERLDADGGRADAAVYTTLIKSHAAAGLLSEALAVEKRMSAEEVTPTLYTYVTLMAVCAQAGDRRSMLRYFSAISEGGMQPGLPAWNVVLRYCATLPPPSCVRQAEDVLRRMGEQGLAPDAVSYSSLAHSYIRAGEVERCEALLERLSAEGIERDTILLNTFLNGYARTLRWERAFQLLREWSASGCPTDATSYVHVLRACVGARQPVHAAAAVQLMRGAGLAPDVRTYSMLLTAYAKAGQLRASLATLKQMRSEGIRPNRFVYASLMEACLVAGQPETASQLFEQMRGQDVAPDAVSYTLLLRAHLLNGTAGLDDAWGVLEQMRDAGGECTPNTLTYNALLEGYLDFGKAERALALLEEMLSTTRLSPDRATYAILAGTTLTGNARGGGAPRSPPRAQPSRPSERLSRAPKATVDVLHRVAQLFVRQRRRLGGEVYLAALEAACARGDVSAVRDFVGWREAGVFQLRREHEERAAGLTMRADDLVREHESELEEDWVVHTADEAEATGVDAALGRRKGA